MNQRILLIEDEDVILKAVSRLLERNHYEVVATGDVESARACDPQGFDLILADLRLPGVAGTDIIPIAGPVPVIIMTSHASVRSAVAAMRAGAIDYIAKPFDHDELLLVIERALLQNRLQTQNRALKTDIERLMPATRYVAGTALEPLLLQANECLDQHRILHLTGESGSGRELLARALHATDLDADAPLVVIECASQPSRKSRKTDTDTTGTSASRPERGLEGHLVAAQSGTLVLRHPERWPGIRLTQLIELIEICAGPARTSRRQLPQRIILIGMSASSQNELDKQMVQGFLSALPACAVDVPPLRHRRDDIIPLAERLMDAACRRHDRLGLSLTPSSEATLVASDWPGNLSELANTIDRAVLVARGSGITPADLGIGEDNSGTRDLSLDEYFRYFVSRHQSALSETEIAAGLGISRKALWERRQRMKLTRDTDASEIVNNSRHRG